MNEQERRKALYEAIGSIDPALVQQATHHRKNHRISLIIRILLVVVILAALSYALLTAPDWKDRLQRNTDGFRITATYADANSGEKKQAVLTDGVSIQVSYPAFTYDAFRQEVGLKVSVPDEFAGAEISIEFTTETGSFKISDSDIHASFGDNDHTSGYYHLLSLLYEPGTDVPNEMPVFWTPLGIDYEGLMKQLKANNTDIQITDYYYFQNENPAYIYIRIYADYHLVGYGVIRVTRTPVDGENTEGVYTFEVLSNTTFPIVNGKYQVLPLCSGNSSYVNALIEWDKENN